MLADTAFGLAGRAFGVGAEGLGLLGLMFAGWTGGLAAVGELVTGLPV